MLRAFALVTILVMTLAFLAWGMPWLVNEGGTLGLLALPFVALTLVSAIWIILKSTFQKSVSKQY